MSRLGTELGTKWLQYSHSTAQGITWCHQRCDMTKYQKWSNYPIKGTSKLGVLFDWPRGDAVIRQEGNVLLSRYVMSKCGTEKAVKNDSWPQSYCIVYGSNSTPYFNIDCCNHPKVLSPIIVLISEAPTFSQISIAQHADRSWQSNAI